MSSDTVSSKVSYQLTVLDSTPKENEEEYYKEVNKLLSQYGSDANPTTAPNTFKIELELRKAQEELARLNHEIEETKQREEEQKNLKEKVKNQRKARISENKKKEEEK